MSDPTSGPILTLGHADRGDTVGVPDPSCLWGFIEDDENADKENMGSESEFRGAQSKLKQSLQRLHRPNIRECRKPHSRPPTRTFVGASLTATLGLAPYYVAAHIIATDFFSVDTLLLKRLYVPFFIELGRRRIWITGVTAHPHAAWVTQQARNVTGDIVNKGITTKFLVRDRDTKYVAGFDEVFRSEDSQILKTPFRTPNANAYAERFVRTIRSECLDHLLIVNTQHLERLLRHYAQH